jgi:glycosyltransferase involved in cell wall biosynthesis
VSPDEAANHSFIADLQRSQIPVTALVVGRRSYLKEVRAIAAVIDRIHPDVVHTHGYRPDVTGLLAARLRGVAAVSTVHGFTGGRWKNRLNETVQSYALRFADAVIAVSRPLVGKLERVGVKRQRITWVPNGFAPTKLLERNVARRQLGLHPDRLTIGWIGRLSAEKGPDVMLEALARTDDDIALSMIGAGRELDSLVERARELGLSERVTWHGAVPEAGSVLPAFDAFVLSSRTEGTPIALLEAMHARTPIIATRVGGVPDVVSQNEALLVSTERADEIAAALRELFDNPAATTARADSAHRTLLTRFSAGSWVDELDRIYSEVVEARRPT